ncbi:LysM peptidoglycan-binding domain-containing protein [Nonomuraea sp. NPDC049480]|uniref:LysM peptidoglycan-binding domain-containing protein n=1 Tax=Nonomuraea sp. NPDC049480 TaxID=3364353 RepID=UPI0037BA7A1F
MTGKARARLVVGEGSPGSGLRKRRGQVKAAGRRWGRRGMGRRVMSRLGRRSAPPVRLTRRGRVVLVVAVALLSLGGFWLGTRAAGHAAVQVVVPGHAGLPWVEVRQGETLWGIADVLSGGEDPGAVVEEIKRLNGLPDSIIHPGTRLYVPKDIAAVVR